MARARALLADKPILSWMTIAVALMECRNKEAARKLYAAQAGTLMGQAAGSSDSGPAFQYQFQGTAARPYEVKLVFKTAAPISERDIVITCTCMDFVMRGADCKHTGAVLLSTIPSRPRTYSKGRPALMAPAGKEEAILAEPREDCPITASAADPASP